MHIQKSFSSGLLLLVFLIQLFAFGLWIGGPRAVMGEECVMNVSLGENVGHSINCDSSEFLYASSDLDNIWGADSKRQSRPGSVLLVWAASRPLVFMLDAVSADPAKAIAFKDIEHGNEVAFEIRRNEFIAGYIVFILFHIGILIACYKLYMRLSGAVSPGTAAGIAGLAVFINNITKQFLWSPHTQLFNIMAPLLSIYYFVKMQEAERPERMFLTAGALCGIGMLFYGIFVLPAVAAGLGYLWRRRKDIRDAGKIVATGIGAMMLFALPMALWYGFIVLKNGAFYNYDVEHFKGFVWLAEVSAEQGWGRALYWLGHNFLAMFSGAFMQGWGFILILAGLIWQARRLGDAPRETYLWAGAGIYAVLASAFFAFYGLTVERLSYTLVPVLFPLTGLYLGHIERRTARPLLVKWVTLGIISIYLLFMLAKFGPYS